MNKMEIYDICEDCIANGDNVYQEDGERYMRAGIARSYGLWGIDNG